MVFHSFQALDSFSLFEELSSPKVGVIEHIKRVYAHVTVDISVLQYMSLLFPQDIT